MKYIVLKDQMGGRHPFIFPELVTHADMKIMLAIMARGCNLSCHIDSAGFVKFNDAECGDRSESLNVGSKPQTDEALIVLGAAVATAPDAMLIELHNKLKERQNGN